MQRQVMNVYPIKNMIEMIAIMQRLVVTTSSLLCLLCRLLEHSINTLCLIPQFPQTFIKLDS